MSILIKGMEMPKEGSWKTVRIYPDGTCAVPNWQGDCTFIQGAQAVPVPKHGRLIDADLFSKVLKGRAAEEWNQHISPFSWSYAYGCLIDTVGLIPTVISADKDGET